MQSIWGGPPSRRSDDSAILAQQRFSYFRPRGSVSHVLVADKKGEKKWLIGISMIMRPAHSVSSAEISPRAEPNWMTSVLTTLRKQVQSATSSVSWTFSSLTLATSSRLSIESSPPATERRRRSPRRRAVQRGAQEASGDTTNL